MTTKATVTYECGGCDAVEVSEPVWMRVRRESAFGGPLIHVITKPRLDAEEHAPDGWMVFDPYTHCTYCPECWAGIEQEAEE